MFSLGKQALWACWLAVARSCLSLPTQVKEVSEGCSQLHFVLGPGAKAPAED
jgi:hypothetical protein